MTARKIITWPNIELLKKSEKIQKFDDETKQLAVDLYDTMKVAFGAGLAAPQVNIHSAMCVIDKSYLTSVATDDMLADCVVLINPEIEFVEKEKFSWTEACLSVPGVSADVVRHNLIRLIYQDLAGTTHERLLKGAESAIVQHETDHLIGKLFLHRLKGDSKRRTMNRLKRMINPEKARSASKTEDHEEVQEDKKVVYYKKRNRVKKSKTFGRDKKRKKK